MGDKGKKDKEKGQKQKAIKREQDDKNKRNREPVRKS